MNEALIDAVLDQIINDVQDGDLTALQELIRLIPEANLKAFLPEETV